MVGRLAAAALAALVAPALGVPPAAELPPATAAMQREALAGDGAFRLVESLTTEVGPRFAGTPGDRLAIAWATARLRALGFPRVWTEPVTVPRWIRGQARAEIVAPWPQTLTALALGGSVGTPAGGIEAAVVEAEDVDALEALPDAAVAGRIVFLSKRMRRTESGAGYGETVPIRSRGAAAAARKGALAVVIRSVATDSNRLAHTGGTRYAEDAPKIPAAALSVPDAELLQRQLQSGREVRMRLELGCRREDDVESANVLAELPGREHPDEIVLIAAHLDSWDVGTGAQDNGTGVAVAIEAARLAAAGGAPRRTIRVLLTANEEFGLSGGRAYAATHAGEMAAHVVAVEADSGAGRVLEVATRFLAEDSGAVAELRARLAALGVAPRDGEAGGGADLSRVKPHGVPLVDLEQDRTRYFDIHHTENDTLDKIVAADLRQVVAAYATVLEWAANRPQRLGSLPPDPPEEPAAAAGPR